jgi:hypothetical protein
MVYTKRSNKNENTQADIHCDVATLWPMTNTEGGRDILKLGTGVSHETPWPELPVMQGRLLFCKCATAGVVYNNLNNFLLHFSIF